MDYSGTNIAQRAKMLLKAAGLSLALGGATLPVPSAAALRVLGAGGDQQVSIAAMIVTFEKHSAIGERMFDAFQGLGATIDLIEAPNNAQIRAAILEFRSKTRSADVALVFVEGGLLMRGDTLFLAPQGVKIRRENDLLTRAVPLSALVRGVSTAAIGGAVFALDHQVDAAQGVARYKNQPLTGNGAGTLVTIQQGFGMALVVALQRYLERPSIDLKEIVDFANGLSGINTSEMQLSIMLRKEVPEKPAIAEPEVIDLAEDTNVEAQDNAVIDTSKAPIGVQFFSEKTFTMAELRTFQASLDKTQLKAIQVSLKHARFYRGVIDGILGKGTTHAIRRFQESRRENVTGYLTPRQFADLLK